MKAPIAARAIAKTTMMSANHFLRLEDNHTTILRSVKAYFISLLPNLHAIRIREAGFIIKKKKDISCSSPFMERRRRSH